jgi:hypothetical protein
MGKERTGGKCMGKESEDEKNAYKSGRGVNGEVCVNGSA